MSCTNCVSSIGDVDFKFHGGLAWLYNIFRHKVGDIIKKSLQGQVNKSRFICINMILDADSQGKPQILAKNCVSGIGDVNFEFHGGASWLYNLFRDNVGHIIKDSLKGQVDCVALLICCIM